MVALAMAEKPGIQLEVLMAAETEEATEAETGEATEGAGWTEGWNAPTWSRACAL